MSANIKHSKWEYLYKTNIYKDLNTNPINPHIYISNELKLNIEEMISEILTLAIQRADTAKISEDVRVLELTLNKFFHDQAKNKAIPIIRTDLFPGNNNICCVINVIHDKRKIIENIRSNKIAQDFIKLDK
jgi:hypothetical protein